MSEKEIPLLPKEEVIIHKIIRRPDKIIMLHRRTTMRTEEEEYVTKRIESSQKLIRAASAELEEIKTAIIPIESSQKLIRAASAELEEIKTAIIPKTPTKVDIDTIIIDIRKRLNKAQELIKNCDPKSIDNISEIDTLIDRHTDLEPVTGYHQLAIDSKKAKLNFGNNCLCKPKRK